MKSNGIVEAFDDFSPKEFIDVVDTCVNNFSFDPEGTAQALMTMNLEKQMLFLNAVESCIYSLVHTDRIDGRNEFSADVCRKLKPSENPLPDVGNLFLRMHPTLQQSAMKMFCCYLDKADVPEYRETIRNLKEERGDRWYRFPLI